MKFKFYLLYKAKKWDFFFLDIMSIFRKCIYK
nr:MAG TPA: hypothetical protein [Caudoviricetes sp.]